VALWLKVSLKPSKNKSRASEDRDAYFFLARR
jgi:hypothetical protein